MTNGIDIETLYYDIDKTIDIACSYINSKVLRRVITSCRLKPLASFGKGMRIGKLHTNWLDEFGNELVLENNKATIRKVVERIRSIGMDISTDLFGFRSITDTMESSKSIAISADCICLVGDDEYFRCWEISGERTSPLSLGVVNLFRLAEHMNYKFKDFDQELTIYGLPSPDGKIENMIKKEYENE